VLYAELPVDRLLKLPPPLVAVLALSDENVGRERREAAGDRPEVEVVHLLDALHADHLGTDIRRGAWRARSRSAREASEAQPLAREQRGFPDVLEEP
jgi:hypothetical protein